jgi:hypothetical protein
MKSEELKQLINEELRTMSLSVPHDVVEKALLNSRVPQEYARGLSTKIDARIIIKL